MKHPLRSRRPRTLARTLLLVVLLVIPAVPAAAQAPAASPQEWFDRGNVAYDAARYDEAETDYREAWKQLKTSAVATALGQTLLKQRKMTEAAQFLAIARRLEPDEETRGRIDVFLAEALKEVGVLSVEAPAKALIELDGTNVGESPLTDPLYVAPGKHLVRAALDGREGSQEVEAVAGRTHHVALEFADPGGPHDGDESRSMVPGIVMTTLGAVGLGVGIAFVVVGGGKNGDAEDEGDAILAEGGRCGDTPTPGYQDRCAALDDLTAEAQRMQVGGWVGVGIGGALAVAGVAYLLWPDDSGATVQTMIAPAITPRTAGAVLIGSF